MRNRIDARRPQRVRVLRLISILAVGGLIVGCQDAAGPPAPSLTGPQFSQDDGHPSHGRIAFHSTRADGNFHIFVMNADGTDQTQLTFGNTEQVDATFSPNGRQILFNDFGPLFTSDAEIFVINADGTGITQLTNNTAFDFGLAWSPDGRQIAFKSDRDGTDDAYVMNADGSNVRRLTTNACVNAVTAWSPNGKQIAFSGYCDLPSGNAGDLEIFVMNADGTGIKQLTDNNVDDEGDHAGWSPDGKLFTFSSRRDGGDLDIFVMNADGTGVRQLTGIGGDFADDDDSVWSPDGKRLAFQSNRDGDEEVYTMNLDGSDVTQLTFNSDINDAVATWAPGVVHPN